MPNSPAKESSGLKVPVARATWPCGRHLNYARVSATFADNQTVDRSVTTGGEGFYKRQPTWSPSTYV